MGDDPFEDVGADFDEAGLPESGSPEGGSADPDGRPVDEPDGRPVDGSDQWDRIPIDLSSRRNGGTDSIDQVDEGADEDSHAPEPPSTPIEAEVPTLENAVFVLLGALVTTVVLFRLFTIFLG